MSDTKSREVLAKEIFEKCIQMWVEKGQPPEVFQGMGQLNGEPCLVYGAQSTKGYGGFLCQYLPIKAVEKIIAECERMFDLAEFDYVDEVEDGESRPPLDKGEEVREKIIREMAELATQVFLWGMRSTLVEAIKDHFRDAMFMAQATLVNDMGEFLGGGKVSLQSVNARGMIDDLVTRAANRKREYYVGLLGAFPKIIAEKKPGRLRGSTKPHELKVQERNEYAAKIEETYRELRITAGQAPTKTSVAKKLGVGGLNPKTGIDSSLTAFNNKLKRLKIDYKATVEKVEAELNK